MWRGGAGNARHPPPDRFLGTLQGVTSCPSVQESVFALEACPDIGYGSHQPLSRTRPLSCFAVYSIGPQSQNTRTSESSRRMVPGEIEKERGEYTTDQMALPRSRPAVGAYSSSATPNCATMVSPLCREWLGAMRRAFRSGRPSVQNAVCGRERCDRQSDGQKKSVRLREGILLRVSVSAERGAESKRAAKHYFFNLREGMLVLAARVNSTETLDGISRPRGKFTVSAGGAGSSVGSSATHMAGDHLSPWVPDISSVAGTSQTRPQRA